MVARNVVVEENESMDSGKISRKYEDSEKEMVNIVFKEPIQGELVKGRTEFIL